jgi:competence protein ComEA
MNKLAKPLVSYRFQHGNFTTLDEIRKVVNMNDETFRKIAPYLAVSDDM